MFTSEVDEDFILKWLLGTREHFATLTETAVSEPEETPEATSGQREEPAYCCEASDQSAQEEVISIHYLVTFNLKLDHCINI